MAHFENDNLPRLPLPIIWPIGLGSTTEEAMQSRYFEIVDSVPLSDRTPEAIAKARRKNKYYEQKSRHERNAIRRNAHNRKHKSSEQKAVDAVYFALGAFVDKKSLPNFDKNLARQEFRLLPEDRYWLKLLHCGKLYDSCDKKSVVYADGKVLCSSGYFEGLELRSAFLDSLT
jgi:hypothetical protein